MRSTRLRGSRSLDPFGRPRFFLNCCTCWRRIWKTTNRNEWMDGGKGRKYRWIAQSMVRWMYRSIYRSFIDLLEILHSDAYNIKKDRFHPNHVEDVTPNTAGFQIPSRSLGYSFQEILLTFRLWFSSKCAHSKYLAQSSELSCIFLQLSSLRLSVGLSLENTCA